MSKAQKFAQKRNTAGGTLKGININLYQHIRKVCNKDELKRLEKAMKELDVLEANWSNNYEQAKEENL